MAACPRLIAPSARASVAVAVLLGLAACGPTPPVQVSESGRGAYEVSLAAVRERVALAWYDTRNGNAEIYLKRAVPGRIAGAEPEQRITQTTAESYEASIAALGTDVVLAWYEKSADGTMRARLALYGESGNLLWRQPLSAGGESARNPAVAARGGRISAAWIERAASGAEFVWARSWDRFGVPHGEPVRVGRASATTWNLNVALDAAGTPFVAFDAAEHTRSAEVYVARIASEAPELHRLTSDDGRRSKYPDLAFGARGFALTWFDERDGNTEIYFYAAPGLRLDRELDKLARRVTTTPGESIGAYTEANGRRYGLVWSDATGGAYDVYYQAFDESGRVLRRRTRLTHTSSESLIPAIVPWRDGFAVAWNEVTPGPRGPHDPAARSEIVLVEVR